MTRTEVHKFGGTSVGSAARIQNAARLVVETARGNGSGPVHLAVISSAMSGVTDQLLSASADALKGDRAAALAAIEAVRQRHHEALGEIATDDTTEDLARIDAICEELTDVLRAVRFLGELTPKVNDRIVSSGEKLAIRLVSSAVRALGHKSVPLDADTFVETDGNHGSANPLWGIADRTIIATLRPLLDDEVIPIVTGFCGRGPDGATTTLGRGGSDLSATVLAGALNADEVTIWTDVDGVYSADPRMVPEARLVGQLNYREAAELSYYGAKVLHQRTMIPVASKGIAVRTRNSMNPASAGTMVDGRFTPGSHPVKGLSAVRKHCLLSLEGKGMAGVPGVAARMFRALADREISVTMISQSSSESTICLAVPESDTDEAERALKTEFRPDLSRGEIEEVVIQRHVALLAVVGLGMAHTSGISARVFQSLGARKVNVLAIAQGSSELNISIAIDDRHLEAAIRGLHHDFGLDRQDTGEDAARGLDLILLGCGNVGRALIELVVDRQRHVFERFGLQPRIVAVADRSGFFFRPTGIDAEELRTLAAAKAEGRPLSSVSGAVPCTDPAEMVRQACQWRLARPVLVDLTAADGMEPAFETAMRLGCDIVTANKKPLAGTMDDFEALFETANETGRLIKAEATVGAGLPVVDTLEVLLHTGDRLTRAQGCFSGTLGYVMTHLESGAKFSEVVADAAAQGYTEPDPVADLSGADVARKALILGRFSGLVTVDIEVSLTGLVPAEWAGMERGALIERLRTLDDEIAARVARAREEGKALRYVARVESEKIVVGPEAVPADSAIGSLTGTDNTIVFESERYAERPLVVTGPGAGIEVTAMGVLGDVLRIAAERT